MPFTNSTTTETTGVIVGISMSAVAAMITIVILIIKLVTAIKRPETPMEEIAADIQAIATKVAVETKVIEEAITNLSSQNKIDSEEKK